MTSTISTTFESSDVGLVGRGRENMSLNTGEARERMSLWARKSRLGGPRARKMISASVLSNFSSLGIVMVGESEVGRFETSKHGLSTQPPFIEAVVWRSEAEPCDLFHSNTLNSLECAFHGSLQDYMFWTWQQSGPSLEIVVGRPCQEWQAQLQFSKTRTFRSFT